MIQETFNFPKSQEAKVNIKEYYKKHLIELAQKEKTPFNIAVADRIIMTKEGEEVARELYQSKVVAFRGFSENHTEEHLRDGAVFSADKERDRLRVLDAEYDDPTDKGLSR
jgi:hypothetical protein